MLQCHYFIFIQEIKPYPFACIPIAALHTNHFNFKTPMLQVSKLSGFLNESCTNGVTAAFLMTTSGALLGAGGVQNTIDSVTENVQAAISANVWESFARLPTNYESGETRKGATENETLQCLVLDLEETTIALQSFGEYVVCLCGEDQLRLRTKLGALVTALEGAFERLA